MRTFFVQKFPSFYRDETYCNYSTILSLTYNLCVQIVQKLGKLFTFYFSWNLLSKRGIPFESGKIRIKLQPFQFLAVWKNTFLSKERKLVEME